MGWDGLEAVPTLNDCARPWRWIREQELQKALKSQWGPDLSARGAKVVEALSKGSYKVAAQPGPQPAGPPAHGKQRHWPCRLS